MPNRAILSSNVRRLLQDQGIQEAVLKVLDQPVDADGHPPTERVPVTVCDDHRGSHVRQIIVRRISA